MSTPQPFPWQQQTNEGDTLADRVEQYKHAQAMARRAAKTDQFMVQKAWQRVVDETAHLIVSLLLAENETLKLALTLIGAQNYDAPMERVHDIVEAGMSGDRAQLEALQNQ